MKVKGTDVTKTMLVWGYLFTLSVFLLAGVVICAILAFIAGSVFTWGTVFCLGLFAVVMKLLLDTDKEFQAEIKKMQDNKGAEDEPPKADEPDKMA